MKSLYRIRLRRPILVVPFALLATALFIRSRLPRPQNEGDKWLWEQAEKVPALDIDFQGADTTPALRKVGFSGDRRHLVITDRQGIRSVLRAFQDTPRFDSHLPCDARGSAIIMGLDTSGSFRNSIFVYDQERSGDSKCYIGRSREIASTEGNSIYGIVPTNARSIERFNQALCHAALKAQRKQQSYSFYTGGL